MALPRERTVHEDKAALQTCRSYPIGEVEGKSFSRFSTRHARLSPDGRFFAEPRIAGIDLLTVTNGKSVFLAHPGAEIVFAKMGGRFLTISGASSLLWTPPYRRPFALDITRPRNASLSSTSKYLLLDEAKGVEIYDITKRTPAQIATLPNGAKPSGFAADDEILLVKDVEGFAIFNLVEKQMTVRLTSVGGLAAIRRDGKQAFTFQDGKAEFVALPSGTRQTVTLPPEFFSTVKRVEYSANSKLLLLYNDAGRPLLLGVDGRTITTFTDLGESPTVRFSANGRYLLAHGGRSVEVWAANHAKPVFRTKAGSGIAAVEVAPHQARLAIAAAGEPAKLYDLKNGSLVAEFPEVGAARGIFFAETGTRAVINGENGYLIVDGWTGQTHFRLPGDGSARVHMSYNSQRALVVSDLGMTSLELGSVCVEDRLKVEGDVADTAPPLPPVCRQRFKEAAWEKLTGGFDGKTLSATTAERFLWQFQKPDGFQPEGDLPILLAILRSDFVTRRPGAVAAALATVAMQSPQLYDALLGEFPALVDIATQTKEPVCRDANEQAEVGEGVGQYVFNLLLRYQNGTRLEDWRRLRPLRAYLKGRARERVVEVVGRGLAESARRAGAFSDVYEAKLKALTLAAAENILSDSPLPAKSELSIARREDRLTPVVVASGPIDGEATTMTEFGLALKRLKDIPLPRPEEATAPEVTSPDLEWRVADRKFRARVKALLHPTEKVLPDTADTPPYEALWADKTLRGLIVIEPAAGNEEALSVDEFVAGWIEAGFSFGPPSEVKQAAKFLERLLREDVDYVVQHTNAVSDENTFVTIADNAVVIKGKLENEEVILFFPSENAKASHAVTNAEFGEWMRARTSPLVRFLPGDTEAFKAIYELDAARTSNLIELPGTEAAVAGLRARGNYAQLREPAFERKLTQTLRYPITLTVESPEESESSAGGR